MEKSNFMENHLRKPFILENNCYISIVTLVIYNLFNFMYVITYEFKNLRNSHNFTLINVNEPIENTWKIIKVTI